MLLSSVPQTPWPLPSVVWDVIKGSRAVARPNVPNAEAHIVGRLGRTQESASFVYLREKKLFEYASTHWTRTPGQLAATSAEAAILREITDLNTRLDNFAELLLWRSLSGLVSIRTKDVVAEVNYKFPASHYAVPAVAWSTADPVSIVHDVRCWKRLIERDGQVKATTSYGTDCTISSIIDAFARTGSAMMSDRMKEDYFRTATMQGFLGLDWTMVESYYEDDATAYDPTSFTGAGINFIQDDMLYLGNYTEQRPIELMIGPSADWDAPPGHTGKFAKSWQQPDPSGRAQMIEWYLLPVITRPEQMMVVTGLNACSPCE